MAKAKPKVKSTPKASTKVASKKPRAASKKVTVAKRKPKAGAKAPQESQAFVIPVRRVPKRPPRRPPRKIIVTGLSRSRPVYIYVDTPDLDRREAERARRHRRRMRNLTISAVTLAVLLLAGGTYYTWYIGKRVTPKLPVASVDTVAEAKPVTPRQPAKDAQESVAEMSFSNPIQRGDTVSLYIQTLPQSICTISVVYGTTPDTQPALKPATADSFGTASWTWATPPAALDGDWPIMLSCTRDGKNAALKETLSIID